MNTTFQVYIPTRGRIGTQPTIEEFQRYSTHKPIVVCPPNEVIQHRKTYPRVLGCSAEGIGPTRQWIVENSSADLVIMIDDDMWFSYRPDPAQVKLEKCEALDPLLEYLVYCADLGFAHGGVSARQGNNRKDLSMPRKGYLRDDHCVLDVDRVNNFHWLVPSRVKPTGARYDQLKVMEDFHFTLTLLTQGHPNRVIYDYVWNQRASAWRGGCSIYRTAQVQSQGAMGLAESFPQFVKVVTKENKESSTAWQGMKSHDDVIIQWEKAFLSSGVEYPEWAGPPGGRQLKARKRRKAETT